MHPEHTQALTTPSAPLLGHYRTMLQRWSPFMDMPAADVDAFLASAEQRYLEPGEVLISPQHGPTNTLFLIRQGTVRSEQASGGPAQVFAYEAGEMLPVAAALARRPVMSTYTALDDVFVLAIPTTAVEALAQRSAVFSDFLNRRVLALLEKSRQALQQDYSSRVLSQQTLETPLSQLAVQTLAHCLPETPLQQALETMHARHIGSMLVIDAAGALQGILTRHDLLGLVLRPDFDLATPIAQVMQAPVRSLTDQHTAQDAAMVMSEYAIRHVPVTRDGQAIGMVSERDLFALQRASLQQVSARIHRAQDLPALQVAAADIRELARGLLTQGVQSRQITELISHLNDLLTRRLLTLKAQAHGVDLQRLCWLALGSEGRGEQTIATDQDNALLLPDDTPDAERERLRVWADGINQALDACGYPLCKGGIMAGRAACCLRVSEWMARFTHWIEHGSPEDLLHASIFFDFRAIAGDVALAQPLTQRVSERVGQTPRFLHQLAINALAHRSPLNWFGHVELDDAGTVDLKLQGAALFVDAARILGLAQGVSATSTRQRLLQTGSALGLKPQEYESWVGAFEFVQSLRLRLQLEPDVARSDHPNRLTLKTLSGIDRRILATSLREARRLQQRLELDYAR
jgi:CBS domain-containing protein